MVGVQDRDTCRSAPSTLGSYLEHGLCRRRHEPDGGDSGDPHLKVTRVPSRVLSTMSKGMNWDLYDIWWVNIGQTKSILSFIHLLRTNRVCKDLYKWYYNQTNRGRGTLGLFISVFMSLNNPSLFEQTIYVFTTLLISFKSKILHSTLILFKWT